MEFKVKNGYVLVEQQDASSYNLNGDFICAKIAVAAPEDMGVIIFTNKYIPFDAQHLLVKIEDISVWIKKDAPVVIEEQVNA